MSKFHITKNGEPGKCRAEEGACPLGGEHFDTPDAAREAYEADMKDLQFLASKHESKDLSFEQAKFFQGAAENYTLIDTDTGTVFSTNAVVMEAQDDEAFYEHPMDFAEEAGLSYVPLAEAKSLKDFNQPVIVELDTDLVVGVDKESIYAVDHGSEIIDFDEILESTSAAYDTATTKGFQLWS